MGRAVSFRERACNLGKAAGLRSMGLLPGTYRVAALEYIEDESWNDPEVLRTLRGAAASVTLAEGARQELTLPLRARP